MVRQELIKRSVALLLAIAVGSFGLPVIAAPASAGLSGRILHAGSGAPLNGAVVKLSRRADKKIYESQKSAQDGSYAVASLPSGDYDLAIEAEGGVFVVNAPVELQPGEQRQVSFSIKPDKPAGAAADEPPSGSAASGETKPAEEAKTTPPPKQKTSVWRKPWFGALVVLGTAVAVGAVVNSQGTNNESGASPSEN